MKIETKYEIGQKVWVVCCRSSSDYEICETCGGIGELTHVKPKGEKTRKLAVPLRCPTCDGSGKTLTTRIEKYVKEAYVSAIRVDVTNDERQIGYWAVDTQTEFHMGNRGSCLDESSIFETEEEALRYANEGKGEWK